MKSSFFFLGILIVLILTQGCALLQPRNEGFGDGFGGNSQDLRPRLSTYQEIQLGMAMDEVARAWGEPVKIQTAGHPDRGNQRWIYSTSASMYYGVDSPKRVIYFEKGRVAGWRTVSSY